VKRFWQAAGVFWLLCGLWYLWRGDGLGCIQFSAMGWSVLLDPRQPGWKKLRVCLALLAVACALLRFIF
jgi:hypothetical protein